MDPTTIEEILECLVSTVFHQGNLELRGRHDCDSGHGCGAAVRARVWFANNSTKQSDNWDIDQSHEEMPTVCAPHRSAPPSLSCLAN